MRKTGLLSALDFSRVTAASRTGRRILLAVVVGLLTGCLLLLFLHENLASAVVTTPDDFTDTSFVPVESPTALAFTPDGRLLVTSEPGRLRVYKDGALLANPALDISGKVCTNGARGLLGIAVDPNFATNNYIYLYYTFKKHGVCPQWPNNTAKVPVNRVERYVLSNSNTATPDKILVDNIPNMHHNNAGDLHFGKDGYLYVTVGDGACDYAGDSGCSGQNDASRDPHILLGKVLRITRDGGIPNPNPPIPPNPNMGPDSASCSLTGRTDVGKKCQETFASGLRNPFRFAFDPNASGTRFFVNDVGEGRWEEVSEGSAGADFAWNLCEGNHDNVARPGSVNCAAAPYTPPIHDYSHDSGCSSITAAAFVPNGVWPAEYDNSYLFGDYTCGKIFKLTPNGQGGYTRTDFVTGLGENSAVAMTFGPYQGSQALYYTTYGGNGPGSGGGGGEVRRIAYTGNTNRAPTAEVVANPTSGPLDPNGLEVTFDGSASSDPDTGDTLRSYIWDFGDGSPIQTTTTPTTSHTYTKGAYTASLHVEDNQGLRSGAAEVRIDAGNEAPTPVIDSPSADMLFRVNQKVTLSGSATDPEDGPQEPPSLEWEVLQHHNAPNPHTHPYLTKTSGNNLTITAPMPEGLISTGPGNYLEVRLTATDNNGLSKTVIRDVQPHRVDVSFATNLSGLSLLINGETFTTPKTLVSWEGYRLNVDAPSPQTLSGTPYVFSAWSDGQGQQHDIVTGATPSSYTATFTATSTACTQNGTSRGETLNGTSGADVICGMGGNDTIDGMGGNDILRGGGGADKLKGNAGDDELYGENGKDKLNSRDGVRGNDFLDGGAGTDTKVTDPTEKSIVGFP
jgi:glucose/arabinose dehydrogenase